MPTLPHLQQFYYRNAFLKIFFKRRLAETAFMIMLILGAQPFLIDNLHTPLSPITGISLSALFLRGRFMLIGILLGSFFSYLINHVEISTALMASLLFTALIALIREIGLLWCGPVIPLARVSTFLKFVLITFLFCALHVFLLNQLFENVSFYTQFLSEVNGILYLTPLCLLFEPFALERYFTKSNWPWFLATLAILLYQGLVSTFIFSLGLLGMLCLYAIRFPPIPVGITLLGLSVWYLALVGGEYSWPMRIILTLQPILSFMISIHRHRNQFNVIH